MISALLRLCAAALLATCIATNAQQLLSASDIIDNTIPETDAGSLVAPPEPMFAAFDWVKITQSPPAQLLHPAGTSVELECEATGSPTPHIEWVRGGRKDAQLAFDTYASNALVSDGARGSRHSLVRVRSRLIVDRSDAAPYEYTCVARAGGKRSMATTTVFGPLSARLAGVGGRLKPAAAAALAAMQQEQQLHSGVDGVDSLGGDLGADSDENTAGYRLHANRLAADGLQQPRIVAYYTVIFEMMGQDVLLPCVAVGQPRPDVLWLDAAGKVVGPVNAVGGGSRLRVTKAGELLITNLMWSDMGTYRCVAHSPAGKDAVTTFVYPVLK